MNMTIPTLFGLYRKHCYYMGQLHSKAQMEHNIIIETEFSTVILYYNSHNIIYAYKHNDTHTNILL